MGKKKHIAVLERMHIMYMRSSVGDPKMRGKTVSVIIVLEIFPQLRSMRF